MPMFRIILLFAGLFGVFFWLPLNFAVPIALVIAVLVFIEFLRHYLRVRESRSDEFSREWIDGVTMEVSPAALQDLLSAASDSADGKPKMDRRSGRESDVWSGVDGGSSGDGSD